MTSPTRKSHPHRSSKRRSATLVLPMVLIDRDGTLIKERHYLGDPKQVALLPGVVQGLRRLKKAGFVSVITSNQSGVGRGLLSRLQVESVNQRVLDLLAQKKAPIDGLFWCPHKPSDRCACRKPELGLVRDAARQLKRSYIGSISVGDRWSDVALGQKAKGKGILVLTGYAKENLKQETDLEPDYIAKNFSAAVRWILNQKGVPYGSALSKTRRSR